MISHMSGGRLFVLLLLLFVTVAGAATGFATASGPSRAEQFWASWEAAGRPSLAMIAEFRSRAKEAEWPPFTMTYELAQGQAVMVGNRQIDPWQMRHMEYISPTQWKVTVLEAAPIETRVGTFSQIGSYQMLYGRQFTEFDAATNTYSEETVARGTRRIPTAFPAPYRMLGFEIEGQRPTSVVSTATVCFQDDCEENTPGLLYTRENGQEWVFADDSRGIPLRVGTEFLVHELRVEDQRK